MTNTEKRRRTAVPASGKSDSPANVGSSGPTKEPRRHGGPMDQARYRFDLALSRGPLVVIGYLGVVMLIVILLATVVLTVLGLSGVNGGGHLRVGEAFWQSLLRVLDSGTFAGDQHWATRIVSLIVTLSGIFLAGSL